MPSTKVEHKDSVEGFISLIGGMHGGRDPDLLSEQQYSRGINTSVRGGLAHTRPAFRQIYSIKDFAGLGDFKGGFTYFLDSGDSLVFCFGTRLLQYDVNTASIFDHGDVISENATRLHFCQAHKYLVIQDNLVGASYADKAWPIILDGTSNITSNYDAVDDEERLPKGQMMAYGHGRIFVAVDWVWNGQPTGGGVGEDEPIPGTAFDLLPRTQFIAGDIFKAWDPDSILGATENLGSGGGSISLASELGLITGMSFQRNVQTGTGHGPLVVWSDRGAATYQVDLPRELSDAGAGDWTNAGLGKILFQTVGLKADLSVASVNNDLIYRGIDGIRTLRYTASEAQASGLDLSIDDISEEVKPWSNDTSNSQVFASGSFADNRYLYTVGHTGVGQNFNWQGLVSLDTSVTGGFQGSVAPIYDGVWTGLQFFQVLRARDLNGLPKHYIFGKGETVESGIWILEERVPDLEFEGINSRPICRLETRMHFFGRAFSMKALDFIAVALRQVRGIVGLTAYYRTDGCRLWKKMSSVTINETGEDGRSHLLKIPLQDLECDETGAPYFLHVGNGFQFAIVWEGIAKISMAEFMVKFAGQEDFHMCDALNLNTAPTLTQVELGDYTYKI